MDWIKLSERPPTKEESELNILVFDAEEGVHEAECYSGKFNYPYYGQEMGGEFKNVIAWMELPLPPKTKI